MFDNVSGTSLNWISFRFYEYKILSPSKYIKRSSYLIVSVAASNTRAAGVLSMFCNGLHGVFFSFYGRGVTNVWTHILELSDSSFALAANSNSFR